MRERTNFAILSLTLSNMMMIDYRYQICEAGSSQLLISGRISALSSLRYMNCWSKNDIISGFNVIYIIISQPMILLSISRTICILSFDILICTSDLWGIFVRFCYRVRVDKYDRTLRSVSNTHGPSITITTSSPCIRRTTDRWTTRYVKSNIDASTTRDHTNHTSNQKTLVVIYDSVRSHRLNRLNKAMSVKVEEIERWKQISKQAREIMRTNKTDIEVF